MSEHCDGCACATPVRTRTLIPNHLLARPALILGDFLAEAIQDTSYRYRGDPFKASIRTHIEYDPTITSDVLIVEIGPRSE